MYTTIPRQFTPWFNHINSYHQYTLKLHDQNQDSASQASPRHFPVRASWTAIN